MDVKNISIVGLGKLGLPFAACLADSGYNIIGVDIDNDKIEKIKQSISPFIEPNLDKLLKFNKNKIQATSDLRHAIINSNITFVILPTPSNSEGAFCTKSLEKCVATIGSHLAFKKEKHIIVISSTLLPGDVETKIIPLLESATSKKNFSEIGVCYSPLFIALGNVVADILNPDFILIGESDNNSGEILSTIYTKMIKNNAPIHRMNIINAEITKLSVNAFITTKISFANQIAEICERLNKANATIVLNAVGDDSRIGKKFLKGALGFGGPCLPRDNKAFRYISAITGIDNKLACIIDEINTRQAVRIVEEFIEPKLNPGSKISILGLSYKPNTPVTQDSHSIIISSKLQQKGFNIIAYDKLVQKNITFDFGLNFKFANSIQECCTEGDAIIIALPLEEFKIKPSFLKKNTRPIILDCWNILNPNQFNKVANYYALGVNSAYNGIYKDEMEV